MDQPASDQGDARPEHVRALANQYADRHASPADYYPSFYIRFRLLCRLGLRFASWQGYLGSAVFYLILVLVPALVITAILGEWSDAPLVSWIIVAVGYALLYFAYPLVKSGADSQVSLHRALADETELQGLMAWDRRWFSVRRITLVAGASALLVSLLLYVVHRSVAGVSVPLGVLARIAGALFLSTLTIVATTLADVYLTELAKRFLP